MDETNFEVWSKHEARSKNIDANKFPLVSIVSVSYNSAKFNKKYFDSINSQTYENIEVILVDNNSNDNTVEEAKKLLRIGKIIDSKINSGLPAGINTAVNNSSGYYVCIIGHDVWLESDCIGKLVTEAQKNSNAIYVPQQRSYDGLNFLSCGIAVDVFGYPARAYTPDGKKKIRQIFTADNGIFLTKDNFNKLGGMDEEHFLFAEDIDLSWKAQLLNFSVIPVSDAILHHFSGGSIGIGGFPKDSKYKTNVSRRYLAERNIIRNILKNYEWKNVLWILPLYITINIVEVFALIVSGQFGVSYKAYLKAYIWNIQNIKSTLNKRRYIQKIRILSDSEIMKLMIKMPSKFLALMELGIPAVSQ